MKDIRNILIVEEDKPHRYMLDVILNSWGYSAFATAWGKNALKLVNEKQIDLLILDINALHQSDMGTLIQVKNLTPKVPVILMTAYSPANLIAELKKSGAADVLTKPIKLEELEATFKKACQNRSGLPSA